MSLEQKIKQLKKLCEKYETNEFITFVAGVLLQIPERHTNPFLKNLHSPMRQLFYLALLNLQKTSTENKKGFSETEWDEMAALLRGIEMEYFNMLGFPRQGKETEDEVNKIMVMMPTYMNYFFNGPLSYQEQEIEKVENIFKPFEPAIIEKFGFSLADFIHFYDLMNKIMNENLNKAISLPRRWEQFTNQCIEKGLHDPKDWINEAPQEMEAMFKMMRNPGSFLVIDLDKIQSSALSKEKIKIILENFSCKPEPKSEISFYTEANILLQKPVLKIDENHYLLFFLKQLLNAGYHFLFNYCTGIQPNKTLASRDKFAEQKVVDILTRFFGKNAFLYFNYSIDNNISEQDILVLSKRLAIIIEVKAAGSRPPMRDPVKAFDKLKSDFKKNIQYGYDQTFRVKKKFLGNDKFTIVDGDGKSLYEVNPRKYDKVFSVIVTLDRFGQIQCDLSYMLEIDDSDVYPWAINMDELEAFLLVLGKQKNKIQSLVSFLENREHYHGHVICGDELELCGLFLKNEREFINRSLQDEVVVTQSDLTTPIEQAYANGIGFKNERFLKEKKDKGTGFWFGKKD